MCSRYSLTSPPESVRALFDHLPAEPFPPRYNIAPTQPIHIVRSAAGGAGPARELVLVRWGLIPPWVKDPGTFTTLINARAETVLEKPSFRAAMRHKRCLIPVDGFYEWVGPKGAKRPHLFRRRDRTLFAFAGLYESWMSRDGSEIDSATMLTTTANRIAQPIHDRMPVIVPHERFAQWLDCRHVDAVEAAEVLVPAPDDLLDVVEVGREVSNPRADGPHLHQPAVGTLI